MVVVVVEGTSISDAGTSTWGCGEAVFTCRTVSPFGALHDSMRIAKITRLNNSQSAHPVVVVVHQSPLSIPLHH